MTWAAILTMAAGNAWFAPVGLAVGLSFIAMAICMSDRRG